MSRALRQRPAYRLLYRYVRWAFMALYCRRFEVTGEDRVPLDRPVLFVTTHQNNLVDALAVLFASERRPAFVARADYFRRPLADRALRFLRMLPMPRADHGRRAIEEGLPVTMAVLHEHLASGGSCVIMPEGSSAPSRTVRRLKKGWARLVLDALPDVPGLAVVPVAIDYSAWNPWGPDVRVVFGEPLAVAPAPEADVPRHLLEMNADLHRALSDLASGDGEVAAWRQGVSAQRQRRDALWRVLGLPALAMTWALFWPVLLVARWAVRRHPRADFQSTLEIGVVFLGVPVWALVLAFAAWAAFGPLAAVAGTIGLPVVLWAAARSHIAWLR